MIKYRMFKTRSFISQMKRSGISDAALCKAVSEMRRGLVDAELGSGVVKKRVAVPGKGKRGSARTLLATNRLGRWFFVHGFLKNERANVAPIELDALKLLAADLLSLRDMQLHHAVAAGQLTEIFDDQESCT